MIFILLCAFSIGAALWLRSGTGTGPLAALQMFTDSIWEKVTLDTSPERSNNPPQSQTSPGQSSVSAPERNAITASSDHTTNDHQVCGRPQTKPRSDTGTSLVYKWVDEKGQTHMSDTPPSGHIASVIDMAGNKRDFTYEIKADGITLPITFQGQIAAGSKRIYDTWHFFLGEDKLRQAKIKLRVIGGPARFDAFRANYRPGSKPVDGFYTPTKNEAYVKYYPQRPDRAVEISFHEISHLITASHLGTTPPWLTEGLAEYFETMEVSGQGGTIYPNKAHLKRLKNSRLPGLHDFLRIDRSQWSGPQRSLNYATAWSLMHFLMQGAPGMHAMQEVVQQAHTNFCKPFSASAALNAAYPGGLQQLESDWRKWLRNNGAGIQQT